MRSGRFPATSKSIASNKNASSFDNQDTSYRVMTCAGFDTMASDADTLRLEDIEKIKFDLNEEKNKIRLQEARLNKLINRFKRKEEEIEQEKSMIQKKKDELTAQEKSLLEEKTKFDQRMEKFKEEKRSFELQKEAITSDINEVRQRVIVAKSKNSVHTKKIEEYKKKIVELNNRRDYIMSVSSLAPNNAGYALTSKDSTDAIMEGSFQVKHAHERNKNSNVPENGGMSGIQIANRTNLVNENILSQIKTEKNKVTILERELEKMKELEEELLKEIIEKEKKKISKSRSPSPFLAESSNVNRVPRDNIINPHAEKATNPQDIRIVKFGNQDLNRGEYTAQQKPYSHPYSIEEQEVPSVAYKKQQNPNISLSSSQSSNYDGGARDNRAKLKKKRSNGVNIADIVNKIDEKNE